MNSDPTPGDPERVRQLAEKLQTFADDAEDALGKVRDLVGDGALAEFVGLTAEAFRDRFDKVPPNLTKLHTSYDLAASALARYWPRLEAAQGDADSALTEAIDAKAELDAARSTLATALSELEDAEDAAEDPDEDEVASEVRRALSDAETAHSNAESAVESAQARLDAAIGLAQQAKEAREEAAEDCANDLDEASDAGMQNKKWWQKAVDWVVDNWDTIVAIAKVVVAVLGIVVMIIGGPLAWVVLAAALIVLADTLIKYANGEASLWDVAFAALDCIPGFKGLTTAAGLLTGFKTGFKGLSQGARGMGRNLRQRGIPFGRRNLSNDPVDFATGEVVMPATDVELPGVLPLVIERHHISGHRDGRWFGRSWASTLDQRLLLDRGGATLHTADGMMLVYPVPGRGLDQGVLPVEGPRWELAWSGVPGDEMIVRQEQTGRTLHFAPVPGRPGSELPLVAISDRNGNRMEFRYTEEGEPAEVVHSGGYRVGVAVYDGRVTSLTLRSDPAEPVLLAYDYDDAGNLARIYNSSGLPLTYEYDREHRLTRWEDRNHTWYRYEYDADGRCVLGTGTDRMLELRYAYDTEHHRTVCTDSLGNRTVYQFNDSYQLIAVTDPLGHTTLRGYDRYDRVTSVTDPLGRTTRYAYDDHGNITAVTRPDGTEVHTEYNEFGRAVRYVDADGAAWRQTFDERGNRTGLTDPAGHTSRYGYDERGALRSLTDESGSTVTVRNNPAGLPVAITDAAGDTSTMTLDAFGRPVTVTDPLGGRTELVWSPEGKPLRVTDAQGGVQRYTWDPEGNLLSHAGPGGAVTEVAYGPFDRPVEVTYPDGSRYTHTYDTELRIVRVAGVGGQSWEYTFDAAGRLTAERDFSGAVTRYTRDACGQLTSRVNAEGQRIDYAYDPMGRITAKETEAGRTAFAFDPVGRIVAADGPGGELRRSYDPVGRLLSETVDGRRLTLTHDPTGRLAGTVTPAGIVTAWTYDALGRLSGLTTAGRSVAFEHDGLGRQTARRHDSGLTLDQSWDLLGRLTAQRLTGPDAAVAVDRSYRHRPDGCPTELRDQLLGARRFELDVAGRVTGVDGPDWRERYTYDAAGNQTSADWPVPGDPAEAPTGPREYADPLLTRAGAVRYESDRAGRTVLRQRTRLSRKPETWRYTWDVEDRLTEAVTPDGVTWRYTYDALGRRTAKLRLAADGSVAERTVFTWYDAMVVEQTRQGADGGPAVTHSWTYEGIVPLTQVEHTHAGPSPDGSVPGAPGPHGPASAETAADTDSRFFAIVTDMIGTPAQLVDETGRVVWRNHTTLWGAGQPPGGAFMPLRFPGQYADEETGWHYNHARHYDPAVARYTTPDPLGLLPSPNPFGYPENPHTACDPLGLAPYQVFNSPGRPDGQLVFSGHGGLPLLNIFRRKTVVPPGTSIAFYSRHGDSILDSTGNAIERGFPLTPTRVYGPGEKVPNYKLYKPDGLNIQGTPFITNSSERLSDLLQPNMGHVHWAACSDTTWTFT